VDTYSVDEINARLDDRFNLLLNGSRTALPRQQTLRATLDWSHELLSEPERRVLRRVSQFLGGFTRGAATAIAIDDTINESSIADVLSQLVARSLLVAERTEAGTRYRLLETIRAYGREKLDDAGEIATTQRRHAQFFCVLFQNAPDEWFHLPEADWRARYLPEIDNVRAALEWSLAADGDAAFAVALAGASGPVWLALSLYGEGTQRLEAAAARIQPDTSKSDQARLSLWLASVLEEALPASAVAMLERAAALYKDLDDALGLCHTMVRLGRMLATTGRFEPAAAAFAEALPVLECAAPPKLFGIYFGNLGHFKMLTGDLAGARIHHERAVAYFRAGGHTFGVLAGIHNVANVSWANGDLETAEAAFRETAALHRTLPTVRKGSVGFALANLVGVLIERGKLADALEAAREALPLLGSMGNAWTFMDHLALRLALAGNVAHAAELAGYADAAFGVRASLRQVNEARAHARVHALLRGRLDPFELERRFAKGAKKTEAEACRMSVED
jgi:tetratricopeptide (TPR) repeat protein